MKKLVASTFLKFKKGTTFSGTFSHWEEGTAENPNPVLVFTDGHKLGMSYDLKDKLAPVYSKLKSGKSKLSVTLTETVKTKRGLNPLKIFRVVLDGKELLSARSFKRLAPKDIAGYFSKK